MTALVRAPRSAALITSRKIVSSTQKLVTRKLGRV
jgi:hypothetical protein